MSFVKLFGFYSVLLSGIRVSSKMEHQVGHVKLVYSFDRFYRLEICICLRIQLLLFKFFDKYVFQITTLLSYKILPNFCWLSQ